MRSAAALTNRTVPSGARMTMASSRLSTRARNIRVSGSGQCVAGECCAGPPGASTDVSAGKDSPLGDGPPWGGMDWERRDFMGMAADSVAAVGVRRICAIWRRRRGFAHLPMTIQAEKYEKAGIWRCRGMEAGLLSIQYFPGRWNPGYHVTAHRRGAVCGRSTPAQAGDRPTCRRRGDGSRNDPG